MKKIKLFSLLACVCGSVCALSGCTEPKTEDDEVQTFAINSLLDGMVTLYQTKNYSFEVVHTFGSYREEIPDMIFTEKYIGYDSKQQDELDVYYNDGKGIYRVNCPDDFLSGEYIVDKDGKNYTNLWDNSLVHTMYGVGGVYIKKNITEGINEITISDKDYKLKFMETVIGATSDYANVDSLNAKFENNKVIFDLSINNGADTYRLTLKDVGTTSSNHLKMFTGTDGTVFTPNNDLSEMRRLINKDNFVQRTYMVNDGEGYWSGYQFFTEDYYFTTGTDVNVGTGYIEMHDHKANNKLDIKDDEGNVVEPDVDMYGIYIMNVSKTEDNRYGVAISKGHAYNSATCEIEDCYNYPSRKLNLLKNLQFVKKGELRDANYQMEAEGAARYYFTDEKLVTNFIHNFSLDSGFQGVVFNSVGIEISLAKEDKDCVICFHAIGYYPTDGMTYDILIPLTGFGDANKTILDMKFEEYNGRKPTTTKAE